MRLYRPLAAASLGCLLACAPSPSPPPGSPAPDTASHARFSAFTARFLRAFLERFPVSATALPLRPPGK